MFGKKKDKQQRLHDLAAIVRRSNGITRAELARRLGVSRGTITKDLGVVESVTGVMFWEDDGGRIYAM